MSVETSAGPCPSCNAQTEPGDRFCRSCGTSLAHHGASVGAAPSEVHRAAPPSGGSTDGPRTGIGRQRWLVAGCIVAAALVVAAIAVLTLGGSSSHPSAARRQANVVRAFAALKARLYPPFQVAMEQRTRFFVAEAGFLGATRDATAKLHKYKSENQKVEEETKQINNANSGLEKACREPGSSVPCPNPTYPPSPTAPSVQSDVSTLHGAGSELATLNAQVLAVTPQPELKVFYAQLGAAINSLSTDAQYNANTLSEAVTEPSNGSTGYVDEKKASTLHAETGLPSVRLMNQQAVQLIHLLQLEISQYDVPGGTDANPADHSVAQ